MFSKTLSKDWRPLIAATAALAVVVVFAQPAHAITHGKVGIVDSTLTYTPQNSTASQLTVTSTGATIDLSDAGVAALDDLDGPGGCSLVAATATCPAAEINAISIKTGDGADTVQLDPSVTVPATIRGEANGDTLTGGSGNDDIDGGLGPDVIAGGGGTDTVDYSTHNQPVDVTFDGVVNDGQSQEKDEIADDIENVIGGPKDDVLVGDDGDNVLAGGPGPDTLIGGGGTDVASYADRTASVAVSFDGVANDGEAGENDLVSSDVEAATGGSGNDTLTGGPEDEVLSGGPGDDLLDGGLGADELAGGAGTDTLTYASRTAAVSVSTDDDANDGEIGADGDSVELDDVGGDIENVVGGSGNDVLEAGAATGTIDGGPGTDTASYASRDNAVSLSLNGVNDDGEPGENDILASIENLAGGSGNDLLTGSAAANTLSGGDGDDTLDGGAGPDQLVGDDGTDSADYSQRFDPVDVSANDYAGDGSAGEGDNVAPDVESILGGHAGDVLTGGIGDGTISGGEGNDTLSDAEGNDPLLGGPGIDTADYSTHSAPVTITLDGTDVEDALGGSGSDAIDGSEAANVLRGGGGDDSIDGAGGDDQIDGGNGSDDLSGGNGADLLQAGAGDDSLSGDDGADQLRGDSGVDSFDGGDGNDAIASRDGLSEEVSCGDGADTTDADRVDLVDDDCEVVTGFIAGPAIRISARALKMDSDGMVSVRLTCVRAPADCEGKLTIEATRALGRKSSSAKSRSKSKVLGREEFSISSGDSDTVDVQLSKKARKAVLKQRSLPVRIRTSVPRTPGVARTLTIKVPKAKAKAKRKTAK